MYIYMYPSLQMLHIYSDIYLYIYMYMYVYVYLYMGVGCRVWGMCMPLSKCCTLHHAVDKQHREEDIRKEAEEACVYMCVYMYICIQIFMYLYVDICS